MKKKLTEKKCLPCEGKIAAFTKEQAENMLQKISSWNLNAENNEIARDFKFKNFYQTMSFVNAVAFIANSENHHPDLEIGFNHCKIRYTTHAVDGLSENDFICAAKINALID